MQSFQNWQRSIDDVVDSLKRAKARNKACTLLIGAGCSVKAGIPTAAGFVDLIKNDFGREFDRAKEKTYAQCMVELSPDDRRDLIASHIDAAKVNWAHICIALLMKHGFVDRVLTVNFDPLVIRACALLGIFPAVYDFAASQLFESADIPDQAVFYLHGQRTGFVWKNTVEETREQAGHLGPVFDEAGQKRVWLVVGYSGENDPVFDHLANVSTFSSKLFWVGYKDNDPAQHVRERLLVDGKYAYYIKGFDADDFFVSLAQRLGCFPPDFIGKPFSYLDQLLEMVTSYSIPGQQGSDVDVTVTARKSIRDAIENFETVTKTSPQASTTESISAITKRAQGMFLAGNYNEVVALRPEDDRLLEPELADILGWAYVMQGNTLSDQAKTISGEESSRLFALAIEKYQAALEVKPDTQEALFNWGVSLYHQATIRKGEEAAALFALAGEKYQAALEVKPTDYEALNNYGCVLSEQAKMRAGKEADELFALAIEKYEAGLKIRPDYPVIFDSWGTTLADQAKMKSGEEAERLFDSAIEKYEAALKIKPDFYEALNNLSTTLADYAKIKSGDEAERLKALAEEKLQAALKVKP
jgi:tetratricopeptide (TPR) repeat protein/NAD-dependent SIR2 family protein deacetylase